MRYVYMGEWICVARDSNSNRLCELDRSLREAHGFYICFYGFLVRFIYYVGFGTFSTVIGTEFCSVRRCIYLTDSHDCMRLVLRIGHMPALAEECLHIVRQVKTKSI